MEHKFRGPPSVADSTATEAPASKPVANEQDLVGNNALTGVVDSVAESEASETNFLDDVAIENTFGYNTSKMAESSDLNIAEVGSYTTADSMPPAVARQLLEGFQFEGWDVNTAAEAMGMIDPDGVTVKEITVAATGAVYTHLEFYMGDTEVGYIYQSGTLNRVAVVSDQDIYASISLEPNRLFPEESASAGSVMDTADRVHLNRRGLY